MCTWSMYGYPYMDIDGTIIEYKNIKAQQIR